MKSSSDSEAMAAFEGVGDSHAELDVVLLTSQDPALDERELSNRIEPAATAVAMPAHVDVKISAVSLESRLLAEQLRACSRLQNLEAAEIAVLPFLCDLADRLRCALDFHIEVSVGVAPSCPPCLGDRLALERALMNLVANGRDAMPTGGCLRFRARACVLQSGRPGVMISVSDTGSGMSADAMRCAERTFIADGTDVPPPGIGLAATNGFAHQSGGAMFLHSPVSGGLVVALHMPQFLALN